MRRWLEEVPSRLLFRVAALVLLPLLAAVVATDVVARYAVNAPLQWGHDVSTLALLMLFVAAIPILTVRDAHIRVETLYERFGPRARSLADCLGSLCGAAFMGLLGYWALHEVPGMYRRGEGAEMIAIPHWPIALFVGVCAAYVFALLVLRATQSLAAALRGPPP